MKAKLTIRIRKCTRLSHWTLPVFVRTIHEVVVVHRVRLQLRCFHLVYTRHTTFSSTEHHRYAVTLTLTVQSTSALVNAVPEFTTSLRSLSIAISYRTQTGTLWSGSKGVLEGLEGISLGSGVARVHRRTDSAKGSPDATACVKLSPPFHTKGAYRRMYVNT